MCVRACAHAPHMRSWVSNTHTWGRVCVPVWRRLCLSPSLFLSSSLIRAFLGAFSAMRSAGAFLRAPPASPRSLWSAAAGGGKAAGLKPHLTDHLRPRMHDVFGPALLLLWAVGPSLRQRGCAKRHRGRPPRRVPLRAYLAYLLFLYVASSLLCRTSNYLSCIACMHPTNCHLCAVGMGATWLIAFAMTTCMYIEWCMALYLRVGCVKGGAACRQHALATA